ncbi:MAG: extracellular solute-binding protein [Spirochaetaceae bacterium]|nr:extracellular solute-binding protein [Spirochaetaceae bacterium]
MKNLKLMVLGLMVLTMSLVSCQKDNSTIVIYSCAEDYRNEFYLAELQRQFPQYNFTLDYQGSGPAAAKLKAEGLQTQGDILLSWDFTYLEMLTDFLADMSYFDYSIFLDDMKVPSQRFVGEYRNSGAVVLNTELLAEKGLPEPKNYTDLLKPEYKGMLSMPNPKSSGTGYMFLKNLVNAWGEEEAFAYFDGFAENIVQFTSSGSGPMNALVQKEAAVALGMTGQAVTMMNDGAPFKIIFFEEGAPCSLYGHAMTRKAESREDYDKLKEVFDYLVKVVTPACDAKFFPEQVFVDKVFSLPNYPTEIPYGDMSNNTTEEKSRLLERWVY